MKIVKTALVATLAALAVLWSPVHAAPTASTSTGDSATAEDCYWDGQVCGPDTTVCYWDAEIGAWLSEYSTTGMCTFGAPLDSETPDWNRR